MKKTSIILISVGLAAATLGSAPFVVNQWITVTERVHAYQRELNDERAEAEVQEQRTQAEKKKVAEDLADYVEQQAADEYLASPKKYIEHHQITPGSGAWDQIREWAKKRYQTKNIFASESFENRYPNVDPR